MVEINHFTIACYGVRESEIQYFHELNKYHFKLLFIKELLNHDNVEIAQGCHAVLLRGSCIADQQNLKKFHEYGIQLVFTRTVGYDHIDLAAAKLYGMTVARVPRYSPNAVAELSLTLGMSLLRNIPFMTNRTVHKNFCYDAKMLSKEVRNCTVGIIGVGNIGYVEAKLYQGLGAKVIGYTPRPSEKVKACLTIFPLEEVLAKSDIVSVHVPYVKGVNEKLINEEFLSYMKKDAILINTARGELQDNKAIINAIKGKQLGGFGCDVFPNEAKINHQCYDDAHPIPDQSLAELLDLFPRVLITPHMGSSTDEALRNTIQTSFDSFHTFLETKDIPKEVKILK